MKPQQQSDGSRYLLEAIFDAASQTRFDIDAERFGNETRFINGFRGIAAQPNVAFVPYFAQQTGEVAVAVVTRRLLRRGEELLVDYGSKYCCLQGGSAAPCAEPEDQPESTPDG